MYDRYICPVQPCRLLTLKLLIQVLITGLLMVLEVWDGKPTQEIIGLEYFGVVRFDLGPLLQGQTRIAELKSAYNSLIINARR